MTSLEVSQLSGFRYLRILLCVRLIPAHLTQFITLLPSITSDQHPGHGFTRIKSPDDLMVCTSMNVYIN